jgi:hypothetical protein
VIFLLDHSYSMTKPLAGSKRSKREALATAINRFLTELILRCEKDEGVRHWFDIGVIGYTTDPQGVPIIGPALKGPLQGRELVSTVELSDYPLRLDEKIKTVDDGAGGNIQVPVKIAIWYEAPDDSEMAGTPMCTALDYVSRISYEWSNNHPNSFPPIIIHITDGESTDGDPEPYAAALRTISTQEGGEALLFNCHLSEMQTSGVLFPVSEVDLPANDYAHLLFRMSSILPDGLRRGAEIRHIDCNPGARGMAFNADSTQMVSLIEVGTVLEEDKSGGNAFEEAADFSTSPRLE